MEEGRGFLGQVKAGLLSVAFLLGTECILEIICDDSQIPRLALQPSQFIYPSVSVPISKHV